MPSWLESLLLTIIFLAGLAAVAVGVALVFLPAGIVVAGVLAAGCAALTARSAKAPQP